MMFGEENIFKGELPINDFQSKCTVTKIFQEAIDGQSVKFGVCMKIKQALNKKEMTNIQVTKEEIDKIHQPFNEYMK